MRGGHTYVRGTYSMDMTINYGAQCRLSSCCHRLPMSPPPASHTLLITANGVIKLGSETTDMGERARQREETNGNDQKLGQRQSNIIRGRGHTGRGDTQDIDPHWTGLTHSPSLCANLFDIWGDEDVHGGTLRDYVLAEVVQCNTKMIWNTLEL